MKSNLLKFSLISVLALMLVGCGDDDKKENSSKQDPSKGQVSTPKAGDKCNVDEDDTEYCDNNKAIFCGNSNTYEVYQDCGSNFCLVHEEIGSYCAPTCASADKGKKAGACIETEDYGAYAEYFVCSDVGNGKYAYAYNDFDACMYGCKSDLSDCADALVPDQDADCTSTSRVARCDGNVYSYCDESYGEGTGYVTAFDCSDYSDQDKCVVVNDARAACLTEDEKCSELGATKDVCGQHSTYGTITMKFECQKTKAGDLYWISTDAALCDQGKGYCNADHSCHASETCADSTPETCTDDFILYCSEGKMASFNCNDFKGYGCQKIGDSYDCYSERDECADADIDKTQVSCEVGSYYEYHNKCQKADNGKNYWAVQTYEICQGYCASDGKQCDSEGYYKK